MITERDVARCMIEQGGSFISKLGAAALAADPENFKKLLDAFPDYWVKYLKIATQLSDAYKQASK